MACMIMAYMSVAYMVMAHVLTAVAKLSTEAVHFEYRHLHTRAGDMPSAMPM